MENNDTLTIEKRKVQDIINFNDNVLQDIYLNFKEIIKEKILLTNEIVDVYEKNIEKLSQEEIVINNNILDK